MAIKAGNSSTTSFSKRAKAFKPGAASEGNALHKGDAAALHSNQPKLRPETRAGPAKQRTPRNGARRLALDVGAHRPWAPQVVVILKKLCTISWLPPTVVPASVEQRSSPRLLSKHDIRAQLAKTSRALLFDQNQFNLDAWLKTAPAHSGY